MIYQQVTSNKTNILNNCWLQQLLKDHVWKLIDKAH